MKLLMSFIKRHPVLAYVVLTFAITWGVALVAFGLGGLPVAPEQRNTLGMALAMLAGPSVAGVPSTSIIPVAARARTDRDAPRRLAMWWHDVLWGFWNGLTAWIVLIVHVFGGWEQFPLYDIERAGNWYDFGFLLGAGSPLLGALGRSSRRAAVRRHGQQSGAFVDV